MIFDLQVVDTETRFVTENGASISFRFRVRGENVIFYPPNVVGVIKFFLRQLR
jgi:hypothetical protein